jgi:predicted AlkP superfamily phosphohydrolase/phosphomutase
MRVLVIGLDGATPQLLFPWAEEGKLPNLANLIKEGVSGKLRSTIPPITAAAWVSFMTGKSPGKHGVVDFVQRKLGSYEIPEFNPVKSASEGKSGIDLSVISAATIHTQKIWDILSENGKRVGVMHVPITYPPKKVNGFMITGLGTPSPESNFTYPHKLREKILGEGYKIHITELDVENNEDAALRDMRDTEEKRCEIAINLMREYNDWDFFFVMFEATDFIQHLFWKHTDPEHHAHEPEKAKKYGDAILGCYQLLDEQIGKIWENVDEKGTTVIIMSDHGGGPLNKLFYINQWLMDLDLIKLKKERKKRIALKLGLSEENIRNMLITLGLKGIIKKIPGNIRGRMPKAYTSADFDWKKTKAYSVGGWGFIYLNLIGREREGIVSGEEYQSLRNYIIEKLYKLKDPDTGENVVKEVYKKEDLYNGQPSDQLPDLILITDESMDCNHSITKESSVLVPSFPKKSGNHRRDGIVIMKGKNIKKDLIIENAEIIDIAPTILYLMGVPIPSDMDGKVLKDAFESSH